MSNYDACKMNKKTIAPLTVRPGEGEISTLCNSKTPDGDGTVRTASMQLQVTESHLALFTSAGITKRCQTGYDHVNPTHIAVPDSATHGTRFNFPQKSDYDVRTVSARTKASNATIAVVAFIILVWLNTQLKCGLSTVF